MIFIRPLILKGCESHVTIYVFESKSLVLDLINDNQVIGFLSKTPGQKPRLLDVICSWCIYKTYRKSSNQ